MKKLYILLSVVLLVLSISIMISSCQRNSSAETTTTTTEPETGTTTSTTEPETSTTTLGGVIPHSLEGDYADCLKCHGPGGAVPNPTDHADRANDTCQTCHKPQ